MEVVVRSEGLVSQPVSNASVRKWAEAMLHGVHRRDAELSVLLCNDETIHRLNRDFRDKDAATDVLAFAMNEGEGPHLQTHVLGDVVISLPTARRQAKEHGRTIAREVRWLLAHGLLHLLGFDHQDLGEYRRMMARQDLLMQARPLSCGQIAGN